MNIKWSEQTVNQRYDATAMVVAKFVQGDQELKVTGLFDTVKAELNGRSIRLPQALMFKLLTIAEQYEQHGWQMLWLGLWDKLPDKFNQTMCLWFGHAWHSEDSGGPESGPGPVDTWCLRCGAGSDFLNGEVVVVTPLHMHEGY